MGHVSVDVDVIEGNYNFQNLCQLDRDHTLQSHPDGERTYCSGLNIMTLQGRYSNPDLRDDTYHSVQFVDLAGIVWRRITATVDSHCAVKIPTDNRDRARASALIDLSIRQSSDLFGVRVQIY